MPGIREQLTEDMKTAMRAKEAERLSTIRMIRSEILVKDKEKGEETSEENILKILQSMVKRREDAAEQYDKGGRPELAQKERGEIALVQAYLPAQMDDAGIRSAAETVIADLGASSPKDMGKVMGILSKQLSGQAAGGRISQIVKDILNS